ncbi:hypothetical protein E2F46_14520 [Luteimonas aestuarii]|uniref:Uncharacterized protein n=1 Tax=Luteimonas aestuarii TaxID=453837 RepID=A0A4V3ALD9_9GAMM|nr:hypothetical protein [Luteimonas aestuarii]TDK21750.1 hypothetical protein E2F46_14520 [Luteimonas aestuarii]
MPSPPTLRSRLGAAALLLLGSVGFAAAWILLSAWRDHGLAAMALLAALDAALLLRLGGFPRGWTRALLGVLATGLMIALACWGIAAARIGGPMGLLPWESMLKMGPEFGWLLVRLGTTPADLGWFVAGLLLAAWASR